MSVLSLLPPLAFMHFGILYSQNVLTFVFLGSSTGKEFTCNAGDLGSVPELAWSPEGVHANPFQYSCLENPYGQRSLEGYRLWGSKGSNTAERLSVHTHIHSSTIHKSWNMKTTQTPSIDERIKKICYIHIMKYYPAMGKNEVMPFEATWRPLEIIILNEVSQKEKDKCHIR